MIKNLFFSFILNLSKYISNRIVFLIPSIKTELWKLIAFFSLFLLFVVLLLIIIKLIKITKN